MIDYRRAVDQAWDATRQLDRLAAMIPSTAPQEIHSIVDDLAEKCAHLARSIEWLRDQSA